MSHDARWPLRDDGLAAMASPRWPRHSSFYLTSIVRTDPQSSPFQKNAANDPLTAFSRPSLMTRSLCSLVRLLLPVSSPLSYRPSTVLLARTHRTKQSVPSPCSPSQLTTHPLTNRPHVHLSLFVGSTQAGALQPPRTARIIAGCGPRAGGRSHWPRTAPSSAPAATGVSGLTNAFPWDPTTRRAFVAAGRLARLDVINGVE